MNMQEAKPVRTLFPFGVSTQSEVMGIIRSEGIDEEVANLDKTMAEWKEAATHFQALAGREAGLADTVKTEDIDESHKEALTAIASEPLFRKTFSLLGFEFKLVEIDKVIAAQRLVNLDYVEELKKRLPPDPGTADLIEFCLSSRQKVPTPKRQQLPQQPQQGGYIFSSESPDFRFLGGFEKPLSDEDIKAAVGGGLPVAAMVLLVGYGFSTSNVFSVGKRIILNNGFHRFYALRDLGIEYAPAVVQKVTNPELELGPQIVGLPKEYILENPRPVVMKDFVDERLIRVIQRKPSLTRVQIVWIADKGIVPI